MTTTIINIPATLNLGCTFCGNQAVIAIAMENGGMLEIVTTACPDDSFEAQESYEQK